MFRALATIAVSCLLSLSFAACSDDAENVGTSDAGLAEDANSNADATEPDATRANDAGSTAGKSDRFVMSFGGKGNDEGQAIAVMPDGTLAVAGYTESAGQGDWDGLLVSMTSCGKVRWARTYGGAKKDEITGIAVSPDGGIAMVGTTGSFKGANEAWLVKTDKDGKLQWSKTFGGNGYDAGLAIGALADGYIVVADTYNFGPGTPDNHNMMVVRTDATGAMQWEKTFGGALEGDAGFVVLPLPDKTTKTAVIMLGGATESYSQGHDDVWLTRLLDGGDVAWSKAYGGPQDDELRGLIQTDDGGFMMTGFTRGFAAAKTDTFLLRTDAKGKLQWFHHYGGKERERGYAVFEVAGGFLVAGHTSSFGFGFEDGYLMKADTTGKLLWWHNLGGKSGEQILAARKMGEGVVMTGRSSSFTADKARELFVMRADKAGNTGCGIQVMNLEDVKNAPATPTTEDVVAQTATGVTEKSPKTVSEVVSDVTTWMKTPCSSGVCE